MAKINGYIYFRDEICKDGSQSDGQPLYDLINFHERKGDGHILYLDSIPFVGNTMVLHSDTSSHYFIVFGVHHDVPVNPNEKQYVKILLSQMTVSQSYKAWFL